VVLAGQAIERSGGYAAAWTDTDGYEFSSQPMAVEDEWQAVSGDPASRTYLPLQVVPDQDPAGPGPPYSSPMLSDSP
jgi:hypothetical protein